MFLANVRNWIKIFRRANWLRRRSMTTVASPTEQGAPSTSEVETADLLNPRALARIGLLEFISRSAVDGVMSGKHRSTHKGGSCEFSDHRPYTVGDDLRLIDWRVYGKRDRHYVKQYEDETNLQAWLVLDTSGSMAFGKSTMTKFNYARMACACLGRLFLQQRDSIGLCLDSKDQHPFLRPQSRSSHFSIICETLRTAAAAGSSSVVQTLQRVLHSATRRGLVIVFSDCFGNVPGLTSVLQQLRFRGHDVVVFQILAPEEIHFNFRSPAIFVDLENSVAQIRVNPGQLRQRYLERFGNFMHKLDESIRRIDCELVTVSTDQDLGDVLAYFLHRRAKRSGTGRSQSTRV